MTHVHFYTEILALYESDSDLIIIEDSGFVVSGFGEFEIRTSVVKHDDKFYKIHEYRNIDKSYYLDTEIDEVFEVVTRKWEYV